MISIDKPVQSTKVSPWSDLRSSWGNTRSWCKAKSRSNLGSMGKLGRWAELSSAVDCICVHIIVGERESHAADDEHERNDELKAMHCWERGK